MNFDPSYHSGIGNLDDINILIYPNPVKGVLNLSNTMPGDEIIITDCSGKVISELIASSINENISLQNLNSGFYFLSIIRSGHQINKRFVIK